MIHRVRERGTLPNELQSTGECDSPGNVSLPFGLGIPFFLLALIRDTFDNPDSLC